MPPESRRLFLSDSELVLLGYPFHLAFAPVMSLQWNQVCQSVQEISVTEYNCLSAVRYSQVPCAAPDV